MQAIELIGAMAKGARFVPLSCQDAALQYSTTLLKRFLYLPTMCVDHLAIGLKLVDAVENGYDLALTAQIRPQSKHVLQSRQAPMRTLCDIER